MQINDTVIHSMGHIGKIVAIEGCSAIVRFNNTTSRVWMSDLQVVR